MQGVTCDYTVNRNATTMNSRRRPQMNNSKTIVQWSGVWAICCLATVGQAQITNKLVVHLPFDIDYTNTVANAVTATPRGTPVFAVGKIGAGAVTVTTRADGSEFSYVTLGNPTELRFGAVTNGSATDFSICFWANYTDQVDDPALISNKDWNNVNNQGWGIFTQNGGNLRVNTTDDRGGTGKQTTTSIPNVRDGSWHHIAAVWVRTKAVDIYVDGALATSSSLLPVTGPIDSGLPVNIGQDGTGLYTDTGFAEMVVNLDDLGIWRRALSSGEVSAIFNAGLGGTNIVNVPTPPVTEPPVITLTRDAGNTLTISWTGSGILYESPMLSATGNWAPSANQSNPQTITTGTDSMFYRVGP
jgi:hypothetical protein